MLYGSGTPTVLSMSFSSGERLTYEDLVAASAGEGAAPPSVLRTLLRGPTSEAQLASWLAESELDALIKEKEAASELARLVKARLGIELPDSDLPKWRVITSRFVLGVEFRSDLAGDPPPELEYLGAVTADAERNARSICRALRSDHPGRYPRIADHAERELGLIAASVDPLQLGGIDTFRFEEKSLAACCARLVADGAFSDAFDIANARSESFWLRQTIERQAQWEAIRLAAELGMAVEAVESELARPPGDASAYVERYAGNWHQVDRAQRQFEAWLPKLDEDADERMVAAVRQRYDAVVARLARGFVGGPCSELDGSSMGSSSRPRSTTTSFGRCPDESRTSSSMRCATRWARNSRSACRSTVRLRSALRSAFCRALPRRGWGHSCPAPRPATTWSRRRASSPRRSVTPPCPISALARSTSRRSCHRRLTCTLGEVQALSTARLDRKLGSAERVVVRSQEIDFFGEGGFQARAIMDTVIDNLARAVRKLAAAGVEHAVITADHGHLFSAEDRDESMRIDAPGGDTIDLHRRCWIGRGGRHASVLRARPCEEPRQ